MHYGRKIQKCFLKLSWTKLFVEKNVHGHVYVHVRPFPSMSTCMSMTYPRPPSSASTSAFTSTPIPRLRPRLRPLSTSMSTSTSLFTFVYIRMLLGHRTDTDRHRLEDVKKRAFYRSKLIFIKRFKMSVLQFFLAL
jgi:hypothetical protein